MLARSLGWMDVAGFFLAPIGGGLCLIFHGLTRVDGSSNFRASSNDSIETVEVPEELPSPEELLDISLSNSSIKLCWLCIHAFKSSHFVTHIYF